MNHDVLSALYSDLPPPVEQETSDAVVVIWSERVAVPLLAQVIFFEPGLLCYGSADSESATRKATQFIVYTGTVP